MECAAIVDVIRSLGLAPIAVCKEARWLLVRVVQMLTRLEAAVSGRMDPAGGLRDRRMTTT
jgi:hypothetical protein